MIVKPNPTTDIATLAPKPAETKRYNISSKDVMAWLKKRHLSHSRVNVAKATAALRRRQDQQDAAVGKDVSGSDPAADWQVIYGTMRVGGVHTFVHTVEDSRACTISIASPAVVTSSAHGLTDGQKVHFITTGALPTGLAIGTNYFVRNSTTNTFQLSLTENGALVNTSGTQSGSHTVYVTGSNLYLLMVHTIAGHEVNAVTKVFFDNEEVVFSGGGGWAISPSKFANKVYMQVNLGSDSQNALSQLMADAPDKWTAAHKQSGRAHVYLKLKWDGTAFPNGLPDIHFEVQGKKLYDPRTTTTAFSANAALALYDYLTNSTYGVAIPSSEIDTTSWNAAADTCDESVALQAGGNEARYTVNGAFGASQAPQGVIANLLSSMGGYLTFVAGKWKLWPAKWRSPTVTLTEADILSDIKVQTKLSKRDNFNAIKGTYTSPQNNWEESDFPPVTNAYYMSQDSNERLFEDISLPFTTSPATAQRLAKIELERIRQAITVEIVCALRAYQLEVPDVVYLTIARFGWTQKSFEVQRSELLVQDGESGEPSIRVALTLRETASGVYDWNNGQETQVDLSPNTNLPDPFSVQIPTGLTLQSGTAQLYIRSDGTVFSRIKVSWSPMADFFVTSGGQIEIQYKQSSSSAWSNASPVPGGQTFTHILDVQDGVSYDVQIRAVSSLGVQGPYVQSLNHVVVGKTQPPSDVTGFGASTSSFGIQLSWADIPDLDIDKYEIRVGASWDTAVLVAQIQGTAYTWQIQVAATYNLLIKALDTSGNYSVNAAVVSAAIGAPAAPSVAFEFVQANMVLNWNAPASEFAIAYYQISYGTNFSGSTPIGTAQTTTFQQQAVWSGLRRFWVAAVDVAGNIGPGGSVDVTVSFPSAVTGLTADIIDNSVSLHFNAPSPASTLPIAYYKIYRGSTFATAAVVGQTAATFTVILESVGGLYTYWVVAFDTAGNQGTEAPITVTVNQPPDFILRSNQTLVPEVGDTITNLLIGTRNTFFDTLDPVTYFGGCILDLDAEQNVTLDGSTQNRVNAWGDRSAYALSATQSTTNNKPWLTRADNNENRCLYSDNFGNAVWANDGTSTEVDNTTGNPIDGGTTADKIKENTNNSPHYVYQIIPRFKTNKVYRFGMYMKQAGRNRCALKATGNAFPAVPIVNVDLATGSVVSSSGGASNVSISGVGSGWYRVLFEATPTVADTGIIQVNLQDNSGTNSYTGDGTSGVYVWGAQVCVADANFAYQYTSDAMELRGYHGHRGIFFEDTLSQYLDAGVAPAQLKFNSGDFTVIAVAALHDYAKATNFELLSCEVSNTSGWLIRQNGSSARSFTARTSQAGANTALTNTNTAGVDDTSVLIARKSGSNGTVYMDAFSPATGTLNSPVAATAHLQVGGLNQYFSGAILRLIAFNRALTDLEIETIRKWLQYRYETRAEYYVSDFDSGSFVGPVVLGRTYTQHFTDNSWSTPQDQINAGFPIYLQPSSGSAGVFEDKIDYGVLLPATIVNVAWTEVAIAGSVSVQCDLSYSVDDSSYTTVTNVTQLFITSFRYLKVKLTLTGADTKALKEIHGVQVVLSVKNHTDQGNVNASATDTSMTCTISIASPAVITATAHGLLEGQKIRFTTTGALPTGLATGTDYFVRSPATNTFNVSATPSGALINTSGTQSGTHTIQAGGTWVPFNVSFLDIDSITGSPQGTTVPVVEVVDFADQPNPKGFNVYLFNSTTGARVAGIFRWTARGV